MTVLENERRMDETTYTVVNKYYPKHIGSLTWRTRPSFVKFQCMHCNDPSCVSACIVGALTKQSNGAVIYNASKCIGCRYCMVACPFQVPAYEYHNALTPQVRKCNFCFEDIEKGGPPACARVCPREAITFGRKPDLLRLANWKMKSNPGKYVNHIYGETRGRGNLLDVSGLGALRKHRVSETGPESPAPVDRGDPARDVPVLCRAHRPLRRTGGHHVGYGLLEKGLAQIRNPRRNRL